MATIDDLMTRVSNLLARVSALLGKRDLSQAEFAAWLGGAATGGAAGDGRFPLTDSTGFVRLVASPAKQMADYASSGRFDAASFASVPVAAEADVAAGPPRLVGVTVDGRVQSFTTDLFAARRTKDISVLGDSEYAEFISCLTSTGLERKIAVSALQRQFGDVIDPSRPPYNVKYDFKRSKPVSITSGSNRVTITSGRFSANDLGKPAYVSNGTSQGVLIGYIGVVIDNNNVLLFKDTAFTNPSNAGSTRSNEEMCWGTDNTVGMQRALDDAEPKDIYSPGRVVVIGGIAMVRALQFGSIAIVGMATEECGFAAVPVDGSQAPILCDKNSGDYASKKPHNYSLVNFSIFGMRYCQYYSSFRRNLDIRGGLFSAFLRGAPYARVTGLDLWEAQYDGGATSGAFAGQFNNIRSYFNAQCGLRMGFWDLNGQNWHVEANGGAGVYSFMPGANVSTVRASYNGGGGGSIYIAGGFWPHQYGANWCEGGFGNIVTNLRMQESWGHSLCFTSKDPLNIANGSGNKNAFFLGTFDDTGNITPAHGGNSSRLPGVRAMVYIQGNTCVNNTVELSTGAPHVSTANYATNAYGDEGNPSGNQVTIRTPGITNDASAWYSGYSATSPGPWMTTSSSSVGTRNRVTINGAVAA